MSNIAQRDKQLQELGRRQLGDTTYAITTLMSRSKINWNWKVEPEQRLCIEFADELRKATREGRLKAIFFHTPNESKRHVITALILKAMGLLPGVLDYVFIGQNKGCFIEFKRPDEKCPKVFKDNQEHFRLWAESIGINCYLHNNVPDALESLRHEGLLV